MKKLLALVLALVMTLSLCVVSSNAAYTDAADVDYTEAVDVLTAIGVFQGSDGKFDPKANLTRAQAAKLVAYLQIGQKAADALVASGKFTDMAGAKWAEGYVDYCASTGIAAGVGNGQFKPDGSLTALQFGKMLLVCLGYDAKAEGFTGADWEINVSKLMASNELLKGLDEVTANSVVTREQAAKMMLNALMAPMVEYKNKATSISVNGADIAFGGSNATYVVGKSESAWNIVRDYSNDETSYGIIELGEKLYPKLTADSDGDVFGRPARTWTYKNETIGTYQTDTAMLTYTKNMSSTANKTEVTKALKGYKLESAKLHLNGYAANYSYNNGTLHINNAVTAADIAEYTGNGILVEIYNDGTYITDVVVVESFFGQVTKVNTSAETITIEAKDYANTYVVTTSGYGTYVKDDYVMCSPVFVASAGSYVIKAKDMDDDTVLAAPEKVTGKVTAVSSSKVTLDGTAYTIAENHATVAPGVKDEVNVYLDTYGYAVWADEIATKDFLYVVTTYTKEGSYGGEDTWVQAVTTEGKEVNYKKSSTSVDPEGGKLYSYSVSGNKVTLKDVTEAADAVKSYVSYTEDTVTSATKQLVNRYFTDDTLFISVTGSEGDLKVFTGKGKQLVTETANFAIISTASKNLATRTDAAVVFVDKDTITSAAKDLIFISNASETQGKQDLNGTDYNVFAAYLDGEKVKDDEGNETPIAATATPVKGGIYSYNKNSDGAYILTLRTTNTIMKGEAQAVYGKWLTIQGVNNTEDGLPDQSGAPAVYDASDAKIVDLTDNDITELSELKSLIETGVADASTVVVSAVFNSDNEISVLYIIGAYAEVTPEAVEEGTVSFTVDGVKLADIENVSYKFNGVTKTAVLRAEYHESEPTGYGYFTQSGMVDGDEEDIIDDMEISTIGGWTFTGMEGRA